MATSKTRLRRVFEAAFILLLISVSAFSQQLKPAEAGYAQVNGIKMYYEVYGEGKPLILLHGAFMDIGMNWGALIPDLSKTRKVIAIDFQGHGNTPFSERKLNLLSLAGDVEELMNFLKVDSADVVGYSMGGSVAYQFAIQYPRRLKKLVIISSTYKTSGWLPVVSGGFKNFKPEFFDNTPLKAAYDSVAPDKTKWRPFVQQMIAFIGTPFDLGDSNIAKITSPVLIISGDNDGLDKVELMKTYELLGGGVSADMQLMPKSHLAIVPSQSHVSLMMQTKTISSFLNGFLN